MLLRYIANIIGSIFLTYLLLKYVPLMQHNDILTSAGVISTVSGILFGFVLATISIFSAASTNSNGVLKALKNNNILQGIVTNLLAAGATLITACLISLIAMFASEQLIYNDKKIEFIFIIQSLSLLIVAIIMFGFTWRKINWILPYI
ncbi:hypothetical protein LNM76_24210 [Klebsiella pneumoniae]|uniref:hypothetical protein n=1 Tax=Klebsiella pneumoniae complex TaxID=3390273 RepID=UPI000C1A6741|nr:MULTISPECIES: hypothetical protein [Klebsiella]ATR41650.1 hypothetical protein CTI63_09345 [Klebsiella pneumoniae]ATR46967.1 hypothetical protein CTI65_09340 [Klebsiella pneumoniae]MBD7787103.1 hypothetical protein [Klebsiella pneumoniae]MBG2001354.1 hypothetical protein [Klebsiella pneumoniae]MBG2066706.1 hypothetical protein [Klebsiella pneumoniae]